MIKTRSEQFKNLLEILIIALLVIIAFFWTTKSYAYTITAQTQNNAGPSNFRSSTFIPIGNNWSGIAQHLTFDFKVGSTSTIDFRLLCYNDSTYSGSQACWLGQNNGSIAAYVSSTFTNLTEQQQTLTITSCVTHNDCNIRDTNDYYVLDPTKYYGVEINGINGTPALWGTNNTSTYPIENPYDYANDCSVFNCGGNVKIPYFSLNGTTSTGSFAFTFPQDTHSYDSQDITEYLLNTSGLSPNTQYYIKIITGIHNAGNVQTAATCVINQNNSSTQSNICLNNFNFTNALILSNSSSSQFDLQAFLYANSDYTNLLTNTSLITITLTTGQPLTPYLATSSDSLWNNFVSSTSATYKITSSTIILDCDPAWTASGVTCALTNAWNILFAKITGGIAITSWKDGLKAAFPFNVYFTISGLAQNGVTNAYNTDNSIYALKLPMITNSSPYLSTSTTVTLLDQNTLTNTIGTNAKNTWFTPQKYLMWGVTAVTMITTLF